MRVATVDNLVTLFYDGSKELFNRELHIEWLRACHYKDHTDIESLDVSDECKQYLGERLSWQQIIILHGVTEIPEDTFSRCFNIKKVIFADTVIRIREYAFFLCKNLVFIKLSLHLEYIGERAFSNCNLSSVFIPPRCRQIGDESFEENANLTILNVPQDTEIDNNVILATKLLETYPYPSSQEGIKTWLKNINNDENFALHRVCCSVQPTLQMIFDTMMEKGGPQAFQVENSIGITPSQYLKENTYADVKEKEIIEKYIRHMMGEF